ncbi:MAG: hypothetical protein CMJ78_13595 [Planctomycetaceae bacterium]|nr:hypothetical protein [Planctomycetaceae bacterium]
MQAWVRLKAGLQRPRTLAAINSRLYDSRMKRVGIIACLLLGLTFFGAAGLRWIEGADWTTCLFMAVITLTTVGFEDPIGLSPTGQWFVMIYLVTGLGVFTYSAAQLGQWVVSMEMRSLGRRRMQKRIDSLSGHYIVCGQGRMGLIICEQLAVRNKPFVVIDRDDERLLANCEENNWLSVVGDATDDVVLEKAGIKRASALTTALPSDADNVYVVLSARLLNPDLQIVARANDEKATIKMERAGASRIVSPFNSGAVKMARFMLNPGIENFLEIAGNRHDGVEIADFVVAKGGPYTGKKLMETDLRSRGVMVIGICRQNGEQLIPPDGTATLEQGDCVYAFGEADAINTIIVESAEREAAASELL